MSDGAPSASQARIRVGVSGWTYPRWRGDFYPKGLAHRLELAYVAARMSSVEVNGSFYSLQRPSSYTTWAEQTPDTFEIAVKGSRYITHMKQLRDIDVALANFFASGVLALGPKLGPVLWQLPPRMSFDAQRMADFFDRLPRTTGEAAGLARSHDDKVKEGRSLVDAVDELPIRHVLEPRHVSFETDEATELLRATTSAQCGPTRRGSFPSSTPTPAACGMCDCTGTPSYTRATTTTRSWTNGPPGAGVGATWAETSTSSSTTTHEGMRPGTPSGWRSGSAADTAVRAEPRWPDPPGPRSTGRAPP